MTEPAAMFTAMASRPTIITDIDNVLAFFVEAAVTALNVHFGTSLTAGEVHVWPMGKMLMPALSVWLEEQLRRGVFYSNLAPDFTAISAINTLHGQGYRVLATSDRPQAVAEPTRRWLEQWGVEVDEVLLYGPGSKQRVIRDEGFDARNPAILIDDDPAKALLARPGVAVWSPLRPWSLPGDVPIHDYWIFPSWDAALDRLSTMETSHVQEVCGTNFH
ncbi:hypothetical protein ORV05_04935 [Amycolatopsis cynarae]|uniref:HAD family hydrolase n=1 Tax=Amycolatopsis cynarae TaxID=2995223 RepID=A0ABY7B5B1_9PSEU|nr:hypothetical protein [Amycolatopsis sp. HUAS 11-8]WAL67137.1 hypothetical protein ORV05_04935 [Amycolatopsis sp. HUAS 11-8]